MTVKVNAGTRRASWRLGALVIAASLTLTACGGGGSRASTSIGSAGQAGSKLIIFALSFPCGLNEGTAGMCAGAKAAGKELPPGYQLRIKTGVNYADNQAFNNLIQTSLQLKPAGMIVFPAGPAAQTPVMNQACDKGVKIVIMDSPATGVRCASTLVGADHYRLGAIVGKWLVDHPTSSKEVGIVTQPPGEYASTDNRVKGFKDTVTAAGYKVVATAITDLSLDKTRTQVTNMVTAHPNLGVVFSANGPMGQGTAQALKRHPQVKQLTLDFDSTNVPTITNGTLSAVGDQHPFDEGKLSVENLVKVIEGEKVPPKIDTDLSVVDSTNVHQQRAASGE